MSDSKPYEKVVHPKHYNSHPSGVECIAVIEEKKAAQYVQFEIARVERQAAK